MGRVRRVSGRKLALGGTILLAGFAAAQMPIPVLRNVSHGGIEIGTVTIPLWSAALAQTASDVTLDNVRLTLGNTRYEAKRIAVSGLAGSRSELDALLSETSAQTIAERMARIDASAITISELTVITQAGAMSGSNVYQDIVLKGVTQGKIAEALAESISGKFKPDPSEGVTTFGAARMFATDIDLPALVRLEEARTDRIDEPWTLLYRTIGVEKLDVFEPTQKSRVRLGRMSASNVMGRPVRLSRPEIMRALSAPKTAMPVPDDDKIKRLNAAAEVLGSFSIGHLEALDLSVDIVRGDAPADGSVKIARSVYTAERRDAPAEILIEGVEILSPAGRLSAASTSLTGFSFTSSIESLRTLRGRDPATFDAATWRSLIPTLGAYRQSDVTIDMSDAAKTRKATLRGFELTADKPLNGVPTNIRLMWDGFSLSLPDSKDDMWAQELRALGYRNLELSMGLALHWDAGADQIVVSDLSASVKDMGRVSLSGVLANVTKDAFDPERGVASAALLRARAKSTTLRIGEEDGLLERVIARVAKQRKVRPEKLRLAYAKDAGMMASGILGDSPAATIIARSLSDYVKNPRNLTLVAQSLPPSGITMIEIMASREPKAILEKVDVTATVE